MGRVCVVMQWQSWNEDNLLLRRFPFRHCWLLKLLSYIHSICVNNVPSQYLIVCRIYILWSFALSQFSGRCHWLLVETIPNAKLTADDFLMPGKSSTVKHQFGANKTFVGGKSDWLDSLARLTAIYKNYTKHNIWYIYHCASLIYTRCLTISIDISQDLQDVPVAPCVLMKCKLMLEIWKKLGTGYIHISIISSGYRANNGISAYIILPVQIE